MFDKLEQRNKYINKVSVIDKVKPIYSINNCGYFTLQQLADYFEVKVNTLRKIIQRHIKEFELDNPKLLSKEELIVMFEKEKNVVIREHRYGLTIESSEPKVSITVAHNGVKLLSKNSLLRLAMFLTNSFIAERIKEELLIPDNCVHKDIEIVKESKNEQLTEEEYLEELKSAYANFGYSVLNKNLEEMHQYIEDIKRLEGEEDDLISKVNKLQEENQQLKAFNEETKNRLIIGFLIVIMKELKVTPNELITLLDKILPKQY